MTGDRAGHAIARQLDVAHSPGAEPPAVLWLDSAESCSLRFASWSVASAARQTIPCCSSFSGFSEAALHFALGGLCIVRPYNSPHFTTWLAVDRRRLHSLGPAMLLQNLHQPLGPCCVSDAIGTLLHYVGQRDELVIRVLLRPIQQGLGVEEV